ncbi:hypothetical protein ABLI39_10075 [Pseudarthrobacter sp. B907]|uniref:hypothetical protein n=1 Tax=Pseudarthrobacter sp. B907 TaxID=3158261 RepID=UPI0032DA6CFD
MNTPPREHSVISGPPDPVGEPRDFIAVDDGGDFSFHRSEQDLLAAFEYVGEAVCVVDRNGSAYRLALAPDRHLVLEPSLGPVEFHWLRQAWLDAQNAHPESHRLRRFFPITLEQVLSAVFETVTLEHGPEAAAGSWSLEMNGIASHPSSLEDIDRLLAHQDLTRHVRVQDPFGHVYRPVRHRKHWYLPEFAGFNLYVEIPASNAST